MLSKSMPLKRQLQCRWIGYLKNQRNQRQITQNIIKNFEKKTKTNQQKNQNLSTRRVLKIG